MSTTTAPVPQANRYPLGLPAGSVRSFLTLMIVGTVCIMILIAPANPEPRNALPPFMLYLLFLIVGSFFSAHGSTISAEPDEPSPFHLPRGVIRFAVVAALAATIIWKLMHEPEAFAKLVDITADRLKREPFLPLYVLGGFFAGILFHALLGRHLIKYTSYQDLLAWVAIVAQTLMVIAILLIGVINFSLQEHAPLEPATFEAILGGIVAFYFAARS
jgi:hypothetical protein